ncbi:MAG: hypothetical protein H6736_05740 [Alphaproteobacteria bacterium]|nr:hypothetical protein [Alphaproteobacteria bacterium]MCB9691302.1 hypothetical protein [Alphaproteobacteria bacterium]
MIALLAAAAANDLVVALEEELARADQLALPDAPPLYSLRYHLATIDQYELVATFGSVLQEDDRPSSGLGVELRVGEPGYDNTGFGGWENGFMRGYLAREPTPRDTREVAWRTTDRAYKQAVEQHARKSAQFNPPPDYPGDYWVPEPLKADDGAPPVLDTAGVRASALAASAVFASAGESLLMGEVHVGAEAGDLWLVDGEGTRLRRPLAEASVRAFAALRTEDGELLTDQRFWCAREASKLPGQDVMVAEVEAMRDALLARADAVPLEDEYVGPVVFEGDAALDLFRYLLVPQIEGTPGEIPFSSFFGDLGDAGDSVRVGRRVLPEGWSVVDDPVLDPDHPASYRHDWDGTPAQRVDLVDDGIVHDLLMSRVPRKGLKPNGHGRSFLGTRAQGRAVQLDVTPARTRTQHALIKKGLRMAAPYGLDHVIVIRRLQEYSVRSSAGSYGGSDEGPSLPPPVEIVRVYADGTETPVRGATFASVQRYLLRDIALAGPVHTGTFLAPVDGEYAWIGPIEGMATAITAPDVLVREIELVPGSRDPRDTPVLRPPAP